MWFINKVFNKVLPIILRNNQIYTSIARRAQKTFVKLPSFSESLSILYKASPRPNSTLDVPNRDWPESPNIDISIIVPCYNVENFIDKCLSSIISQKTSQTFEVICIDDGSSDATPSILDSFAKRNQDIRVIHQKNKGLSGARNRGISEAQGKMLMFVDSDDELLPGAIEHLSVAYKNCSCDYVTASYKNLLKNGKVLPIHGRRTHGAPWGRLYSREIWRSLEFPEGYWFEDTVQGFCIDTKWKEEYIDIPVYLYRNNTGGGITSSSGHSKKSLDSLWIVDELLSWCKQLDISYT